MNISHRQKSLAVLLVSIMDKKRGISSLKAILLSFTLWFLTGGPVIGALAPEDMESLLCKATVRVVIFEEGEYNGHGTGFLISPDGYIATNKHVAIEGGVFGVIYSDHTNIWIRKAAVVGRSSGADLAILKVDPIPGMTPLTVYSGETSALQEVTACGFPGVLDTGTREGIELDETAGKGRFITEEAKADFVPLITTGKVTKSVIMDGMRVLHHTVKISGGNSGGALVDVDGRVVGINTFTLRADGDYAVSLQSTELIGLASSLNVRLKTTSSKASAAGSISGLHLLLYIVLAAFAVVMFLMVLRKPRTVMVDAMSRVVRSRKHDVGQADHRQAHPGSVPSRTPTPSTRSSMRLRGRDMQGISYDLSFSPADFERGGGRLVIGRNNDLSQLVLSQDSVSRQHATLLYRGGSVQVEDRNSGNGTRVNGRDLVVGQPPVPLSPGDKLTLGEVDLIFEILN